jgi:hypothetical protein
MNKLRTIDTNNNLCEFQYKVEYGDELNPDLVYFKVFTIPENPMRCFSYTFKIIDSSTAKGEMMTNNGCIEFSQKGIPEKIIEIASHYLQKNIISSPLNPQAADYLVGPSKKAWERLVANNENANLNEYSGNFEFRLNNNENVQG